MIQGLLSVFRAKGYDGASLSDLAEATGLKKASLYHRFPEGKKAMTAAVLAFLGSMIEQDIYQVLTNKKQAPEKRLALALDNISSMYQGGKVSCIFRALSMDTGIKLFSKEIRGGITRWLEAFTILGVSLDMDQILAEKKAEQTFIDIQGSLVLSKAMDTTEPFEQILTQISQRYSTV